MQVCRFGDLNPSSETSQNSYPPLFPLNSVGKRAVRRGEQVKSAAHVGLGSPSAGGTSKTQVARVTLRLSVSQAKSVTQV
jgi:hypothetical protein